MNPYDSWVLLHVDLKEKFLLLYKFGMPLAPFCWFIMYVNILNGLRSPTESKVKQKYDYMVSKREMHLLLKWRVNKLLANRSRKIETRISLVHRRNWKTPWSTWSWPDRTRIQELRWWITLWPELWARANKNIPESPHDCAEPVFSSWYHAALKCMTMVNSYDLLLSTSSGKDPLSIHWSIFWEQIEGEKGPLKRKILDF